ncbi:MAG TPA: hypothetical protein VHF07_03800 [Nitrospiraceae bacterium]|nr:hypothetical protein [Nitrospiraceae bacterium]
MMRLIQRVKHDLKVGWATLRHGTARAAHRALEETELLRYRLELRKVEQQLDDVYGDLGERTLELHDRGEPMERILYDGEISRLMKQARALQDEQTKLLLEMNDIAIEDDQARS